MVINRSIAEVLKRSCNMKPAQRRAVSELPILPDNSCDPQKPSDLIGDIYDTVLDQSLWEGVIERAAHFVRGTGAALFTKNVANQDGSVQYVVGIDPHYTQLYFDKYVTLDPATGGHFLAEIEQPVAVADLMSPLNSWRHDFIANGCGRRVSSIS